MPSKLRYYPINSNQSGFQNLRHYKSVKKKKAILAALISSYALLIIFSAYAIFSGGLLSKSYAGNTNIEVKSTIKLEQKDEYNLGDTVKTSVTIENISADKEIKDVKVKIVSTNNSVKWLGGNVDKLHSGKSDVVANDGVIELGNISASNQYTLNAEGLLTDAKSPYLAVYAEVEFTVLNKKLKTTTNKSFTKLSEIAELSASVLKLKSDKAIYEFGEDVNLTLNYDGLDDSGAVPKVAGSIFINGSKGQSIATESCFLGDTSSCVKTFKNLPVDSYSAIFINDSSSVFSQIAKFDIKGAGNDFTPSPLANLALPFGRTSVNGYVPVFASSVLDQNTQIDKKECTFEILKDVTKEPIKKLTAPINNDRNCALNLKITDVPEPGEYSIRLARTANTISFYFSNPPSEYLPLSLPQIQNTPGKEVRITSTDVKSLFQDQSVATNAPASSTNTDSSQNSSTLNQASSQTSSVSSESNTAPVAPTVVAPAKMLNGDVTVGIFHYETGEYKEIGNAEATLRYNNGSFDVNLPSNYFSKGGFYQMYIKTYEIKDGQRVDRFSDFVGFTYDVNDGVLSSEGIEVKDFNNLIVGRVNEITLTGIKNSNGNTQNSGECLATFYPPASAPFTISGAISTGKCTVLIGEGKITKPGPTLVTFYNQNKEKSIAQSRILDIRSGSATNFGVLTFENEPVSRETANNMIIGPVVDGYGNLTSGYGYHLNVWDISSDVVEEHAVIYTAPVNIEKGFFKDLIPASIFTTPKLKFDLVDGANTVLLSRELEVGEGNIEYPEYNFEKQIKNSDNISISTKVPNIGQSTECSLTIIGGTGDDNVVKVDGVLNEDNGDCNIDFALEKFRNLSQLLYKIKTADIVKYALVEQKPTEPASSFVVAPSVYTDNSGYTNISLITSSITDKAGMIVDNLKMSIQYNGRISEADVVNGVGKMTLYSKDILSRDIKNIGSTKVLSLDIDAKVSLNSISPTTSVRIGLNNIDLANESSEIKAYKFDSRVNTQSIFTFIFKTNSCNVRLVSERGAKMVDKYQDGDKCYVQAQPDAGQNSLIFEDDGYEVGKFDFKGEDGVPKMIWCSSNPCKNQVITHKDGKLEGKIKNGDDEYFFNSNEGNTVIEFKKEGLSPLREYFVEIKFTDIDGNTYVYQNNLLGSLLQ